MKFDDVFEVARMPAQGGDPVRITHGGGMASAESPDGRLLYYIRREPDAWNLRQCNLDGSGDRELIANIMYCSFAVAPGGIYFIPMPGPDDRSTICFRSSATGQTTVVTAIQKPQRRPVALSADGKFLLFSQFDHWGRDLVLIENWR